ncbi:MAG: hypothetical protein R3B96_10380 [Pirellulaceae bacterium]
MLNKVSQLRTPELDTIILQARHQQAYELTVAWWELPTDEERRATARASLARLEESFAEKLGRLEAEEETLQDQLDRERSEEQTEKLLNQAGAVRAAYLRALFYAAWNDLYLASTETNAATRTASCDRGRARLGEFLEFEYDRDSEGMDAESLALEVPLRARAALGMALIERVAGNDSIADQWLNALNDDSVVAAVRQEKEGESILLALIADRPIPALSLASKRLHSVTPPAQVPDVRLGRTLVRQGEMRLAAGGSHAEELRMMGYETLVRLRQFQLIDELRTEFPGQPPRAANFWMGWMLGHELLAKAEASGRAEDFAAAAEALARARELPEARAHLPSLGRALFELGWAEYRSDQLSTAVDDLEQATQLLRSDDRDLAVESAWLRAICFQQMAQDDPTQLDAAVAALQEITITFADHPKATEAKYQLARLQRQSGSSARSIAVLEAIGSSDPNYLMARFELVTLRYEAWKNAAETDKAEAYLALANEVRRFSTQAIDPELREKRLRDPARIGSSLGFWQCLDLSTWLDQAENLASQFASSHGGVAQYHYLRMQQLLANEQAAAAQAEARWLAEQADDPTYRKSGLVYVTRELERRWEAANESQRPAISREAVPAYRTLVSLLGDSPTTLRNERNARVAAQRLGVHAFAAGDMAEALRVYEPLAAAFPTDSTALRGFGLAAYEQGAWDKAVEPWAKLAAGLQSGSAGWYEARYYELDCLRRLRPDDARKVWNQFQLLHPDIPFEPWRTRFQTLAQQLGG